MFIEAYLFVGEGSEGVDELFGRFGAAGLLGHEAHKGVKCDETGVGRIDGCEDLAEVHVTLKHREVRVKGHVGKIIESVEDKPNR